MSLHPTTNREMDYFGAPETQTIITNTLGKGVVSISHVRASQALGYLSDAVREGVRGEAAPMGRQLAEVRGLLTQTIRRLERVETDITAERYSRVDDLGLLVDLITSGWRSVDDRLARIERAVDPNTALAEVRPLTPRLGAADAG